jgi:1-aminocyclopropane-1-carboxylate deaminase
MNEAVQTEKAVLQRIVDPFVTEAGVKLYIKREDLIHSHITGNKWYKLKYNLEKARQENYDTLLSFGGAFSNHIYALAAAGRQFNFKTIGIIRGEEYKPLNPTLQFAKDCGMELFYITRSEYRRKTDHDFIEKLKSRFGRLYLIPEGGTNNEAVKGCSEIIDSIDVPFDYICSPCGTGGTLAGLITGLDNGSKAIGFPVLKGAEFLENDINKLLNNEYRGKWKLIYNYHFGGYAKYNNELLEFMYFFEDTHNIPLDQVYTGKMMYGIYDLIKNKYFKKDDTIIILHTGGIQGRIKLPRFLRP